MYLAKALLFLLFFVFIFYFVLNDVLTHHINECCLNKKEQIYINLLEMRMFNSNPHNAAAVLFILHPTCFSFSNYWSLGILTFTGSLVWGRNTDGNDVF